MHASLTYINAVYRSVNLVAFGLVQMRIFRKSPLCLVGGE